MERLTAALRASSLPERKLAELSGLARATGRRIIGRYRIGPSAGCRQGRRLARARPDRL